MSSPDIIERLRKENLEQFLILVRMHLSFVVDICTDDVDGSTDKPKQFRWNFKKAKSLAINSSQNNANNAKSTVEVSITEEGMSRVYELIDFLSKEENVKQEGIFRRTGSLTRQQELRQLLLTGCSLDLDDGRFTVHDCASVLKGFIAELPQPLLMDQYYQTYCTLAAQYPPHLETSEPKLLTALQLLLFLLSPLHRAFLRRLLTLLRLAADNEASNRMSPDTLATMFTPHLMCPRKLSPETFHENAVALSPLVSFMIRQAAPLFVPPAPLLTDVSAYYAARASRDLDKSVTDRTAASTVYTFVDRLRTSAENSSNPTHAALAQLYAHIQALPDSQHKRRLVKQFNRQNGYGTPIQIQRTGKAAGSRSFGDSIKRHIFNKGLLNKTPKKGSGNNINTVEERVNKQKLRLSNEEKSELTQNNVVPKSLTTKMASIDCVDGDDDFTSDSSNESTLSDGALNKSKKRSPKFVSEPNLSVLDSETPKNTKKRGTRLFRSKILLASQNLNKRYQKRNTVKGTPTCVSCFEQEASENDISESDPIGGTPLKSRPIREQEDGAQPMKYLTSTPGVSEMVFEENTDYVIHFRRASMSPITKSTQKLSKAMQESIMTPRSRKPLIVTSEQRDSLPEKETHELSKNSIYQSLSPKNDSDFVSSDDDFTRSNYSESNTSGLKSNTRFVERPNLDLNTTLCETNTKQELTGPFRDYLLSRSVLTATPVDLSIVNKSTDEVMTDSLMYCLDGNVPSDLTSSINNLAVDKTRSPLKSINSSPSRKRGCPKEAAEGSKKPSIEKENATFELRETEL